MNSLCKYKDIFGVPRQGVHAWRIQGVAAFDVIGTVIGAWLLARYTGWSPLKTFIALCVLGFALHRIFCVETALLS